MRMEGVCDFCGAEGDWDAGLFEKQSDVKARPESWAALFPSNIAELPSGCSFGENDLKAHNITTACACPNCVRKEADSFVPPSEEKPKTIEEIIAEQQEAMKDVVAFNGYTHGQLAPAFKSVQDKEHWKNQVNATIPGDSDTNLISAAIAYFTGSHAEFFKNTDGTMQVVAAGYFATIGA